MMVLWLLLTLASAHDCSRLCANQTTTCIISQVNTVCDTAVRLTASTSISVQDSTIYCVNLQNKGEPTCSLQLRSSLITIERSRLVSSYILLNAQTVSITADSVLDANGTGYITGSGTHINSNDGPSYGGRGGGTCGEPSKFLTYGDQYNPREFYGSGGTNVLTRGGGIIIVEADQLYFHGLITASGNVALGDPYLGTSSKPKEEANGGTGGSVFLNITVFADCMDGRIVAAGGNALNNGYGGGGGRVALYGRLSPLVMAPGGVGTRPRCHEAGAGTIYFGSTQTLVVDNGGIVTRNPTPVSTQPSVTLHVRNGATVTPLFSHIPLIAGKIELLNARLEASQVAGSGLNFDSTLQLNATDLTLLGKSTLGRTDIETLNITVKTLNVDYSSGIYFGSKLRIEAQSVEVKGEIEGNLVVPDVSWILISSNLLIQKKESTIKAERIAILSNMVLLEGTIQSSEQSCHDSEDFFKKNPPYHFVRNATAQNLTIAQVQTLLDSNFTQLIVGTFNVTALDNSKIIGSRIGLFGRDIAVHGMVSASGYGCFSDKGLGKGSAKENMCAGSGAGYGGRGGNGRPIKDQYVTTCAGITDGGRVYSDDLSPWFEGSGGGSDPVVGGSGGGFIDIEAVNILNITGMISADGEDAPREASTLISGSGGGSGGGIFICTKELMGIGAKISAAGGRGTVKGGGGGGGRILFSWIGNTTDEVHTNLQNHSIGWEGVVEVPGGMPGEEIASGINESGANGTLRAEACAPGTAGYLCQICPKGTYKSGTLFGSCQRCINKPRYGEYTQEAETSPNCAYQCPAGYTDVTQNKDCDSPLKEFFTMFGGIGGAVGVTLAALSLVALIALLMIHYCSKWRRIYSQTDLQKKLIAEHEPSGERRMPKKKATHPELTREDLPFHEQRICLIGDNSYHRPWCLPTTPHAAIQSEVLPEQYATFANGINVRSRWFRWHYILCWVLLWVYHPLGLLALSMSRKHKYQEIRDYIQRDAEEMWRKIDVRLLANSLRFSCSDDCTLAYIDIISCTKKIEQWEERPVLPLSLLAQGDGSFYHPFKIDPNDLLLQLVCAGLDSDALEEFQMYIHSFNMQLRTVKLNCPLPNRSQMEFLEMRKLLGKFNDELLNRANYQVTLALFQAQMCVLEGKYVENILSARLNSGLIDEYSDQLQRGELKRLYSFRLGLIFTDYRPKKALSQSDSSQSVSRSLHYEANLTGLDALPGLKSASDPVDSAPFWECSLRGLLLVPGMWNQHLVLFILSLLVLMDIVRVT